ncbi:MAG TPA: hypothetical protein VLX44_09160 [Xanthobacteraceae bacterium]|nr:hypothetical protein [Xanthobacteraceae bacterium]
MDEIGPCSSRPARRTRKKSDRPTFVPPAARNACACGARNTAPAQSLISTPSCAAVGPGTRARRRDGAARMPGKRVSFDEETWTALDLLARDRAMDFQALADEAFRDLLQKHDRPTGLTAALRRSAKESGKPSANAATRRSASAKRQRARRG